MCSNTFGGEEDDEDDWKSSSNSVSSSLHINEEVKWAPEWLIKFGGNIE